MSPFWLLFLATLTGLAVFALVLALLSKTVGVWLLNGLTADFFERLARDRYTGNLFGLVNVFRHVGAQTSVETLLRAGLGRPLARPLGSPLALSPWEKLLFQPVYLKPRLPTPENVKIGTEVIIGPRAAKPLKLKSPIIIAAMSYGGALSVQAKLALAKGANLAGTATNSGEAFLNEERRAADRLIIQHHRGLWPNGTMQRPEILEQADAVEIHLGQGAQAAAPMQTRAKDINRKMREVYGLKRGEAAERSSRFQGVDTPEAFIAMVSDLRQRLAVPIGVKLGVSDYVEEDLAVLLEAGVDFITIDGAEGGTHGGPTALQDDVGLPTLHGLVRADDYLRKVGARERVSLLAAGQLTGPGRFLKAMALGADAVYIGSTAILAVLGVQFGKTFLGEPPYDLVMHGAKATWNRRLNVERSGQNLANYLASCLGEMSFVAGSLGKTALTQLDRSDLVALSPEVAEMAGVRLAWPVEHRPAELTIAFERPEERTKPGTLGEERIH